jgi:hypothetical protein
VTFNKNKVPFDITKTIIPSWSYDGDSLSIEVITGIILLFYYFIIYYLLLIIYY